MNYRISADIQYIDGALEGIRIVNGLQFNCPDMATASREASRLDNMQIGQHPIRAAVTGNRYLVVGTAVVIVSHEVEYVSTETAYGRTVAHDFSIKVF